MGVFFKTTKKNMSKSRRERREERRSARQAVHANARAARANRKALRQQKKTERKEQRQDAKTRRQELRQQGREDRLKARIQNRAKEIKDKREEVLNDVEKDANNQGIEPAQAAANKLSAAPEKMTAIRSYIAKQTDQNPEELEKLNPSELSQLATGLRSEEIEDVVEPIASEIQEEGDTLEEEFENFEFFEAALSVNNFETPECYEDYGVIDDDTWALISGVAKGGAEIVAKNRFAKGKKFLGKSEKDFKAPEDPNAPSSILKDEATKSLTQKKVNDNIIIIVVVVVVLSFLVYFATRKAK